VLNLLRIKQWSTCPFAFMTLFSLSTFNNISHSVALEVLFSLSHSHSHSHSHILPVKISCVNTRIHPLNSVTPAIGLSGTTKQPPTTHYFIDSINTTKMRPSLVSLSLYLLTLFASTGTALEALTDSPCGVQCGNDLGGTSGNDIVCPDSSYTSTLAGQTFSSCITCQLSSKYVDPITKQTDLQWGLCTSIPFIYRLIPLAFFQSEPANQCCLSPQIT
jgi:hypothetical protein